MLAAGLACAAPFSHKLHLKLKPACTECHATAPSSVRAGDSLLPKAEACVACHQPAPAIKEPPRTLVTKFNHQLHAKLGEIAPLIAAAIDKKSYHSLPAESIRKQLDGARGCAGCHRGLAESDAVSKDNFPRMADCLVCHSQIQPPFTCEKCHDPGAHLLPLSHVAGYLESHSSPNAVLDKPSCVVCHGRRFTCLGCH